MRSTSLCGEGQGEYASTTPLRLGDFRMVCSGQGPPWHEPHFNSRQSGSGRRHCGQDQDAGRGGVALCALGFAWRANAGTVCVFGGRGEFIEKYFETVNELRNRGFAVATMDWRGQGHSSRQLPDPRKGLCRRFFRVRDRRRCVHAASGAFPIVRSRILHWRTRWAARSCCASRIPASRWFERYRSRCADDRFPRLRAARAAARLLARALRLAGFGKSLCARRQRRSADIATLPAIR